MPALPLHIRLAVPDVVVVRVMLAGLSEHASPSGTMSVRETVPVKPFTAATVIVELASLPAKTVALVGLAVTMKSWTVNVIGPAEWDSPVLVPVTKTWKVPVVVNVHDSVLMPEPTMDGGLRVHAVLLAERLTVPEKPFRPVTVMVEVPGALTFTVTDVGLALSVKSWTLTVTMAEWTIPPDVPVTVHV